MRSEHTAMPGDQRTRFVNEHRVGEAKFADRGSDLRYLLVAMSASISGVWDQPTDRPPLDLVGRPRPFWRRAITLPDEICGPMGRAVLDELVERGLAVRGPSL
jgi:hypothetical protein